MKKNISILGLLLDLFVCMPLMTACGEDEEESNPVLGTWHYRFSAKGRVERIFNSDFTFTQRYFRHDRLCAEINGKYKIKVNQLTLLFDDIWSYYDDGLVIDDNAHYDGTFSFVIDGKKLIIYGELTWYK